MRSILSEKSIVVILFVLVLITFAFAQEDSKKIQATYNVSPQPNNFSSTDSPSLQTTDAPLIKAKNSQTDLLK